MVAQTRRQLQIAPLVVKSEHFEQASIESTVGELGHVGVHSPLAAQHVVATTRHASTSIIDMLETYSSFLTTCARKKLKNIQQFYDEPMGQRYALANGLLLDFRKPENKDYITKLGYEPYLAELEELNTRYATLKARRSEKRTKKTNSPTTAEINRRVENVIKVINSYADATVVLQPNEMAKKFVLEVNNLVEEIRLERRKKGKTEGN